MIFFMLTNILTESTELLCVGQGAVQLAAKAFHLDQDEETEKSEPVVSLPGVVSRKKQLIPELMLAECRCRGECGRCPGIIGILSSKVYRRRTDSNHGSAPVFMYSQINVEKRIKACIIKLIRLYLELNFRM